MPIYILIRLDRLNIYDAGLRSAYTYDNVSNILTKTTEHGQYDYGYDDVYRLLTADNPTQDDEAYTYDGVGNRDTATNATGSISHNTNNELLVYGEVEYDYDANGNLTQKRQGTVATNYMYNVANRLIRVEDDLSGLIIADYGYDPFGRRLWKEVDGTRTYFFYADEGLVAEYDESGNEIRTYGYRPDSTWTTDPLWLKEGGQYYWYQNDHLGTPQTLIDMNGTVVWSATYTVFGAAQIQTETIINNLRFPGQYFDAETGLHSNYFRYYDPDTGRYWRTDPLGFDGGDVNWYAYVWNNPINVTDPLGLQVGLTPIHWGFIKAKEKFNKWLSCDDSDCMKRCEKEDPARQYVKLFCPLMALNLKAFHPTLALNKGRFLQVLRHLKIWDLPVLNLIAPKGWGSAGFFSFSMWTSLDQTLLASFPTQNWPSLLRPDPNLGATVFRRGFVSPKPVGLYGQTASAIGVFACSYWLTAEIRCQIKCSKE